MGLFSGIAKAAKSAYKYIRYGKQVGSAEKSVLSKGSVFAGQKNTRSSTHVVTNLYNAPNQYNVVRHAGNFARVQTYNNSGKLLGTTYYPYNDNAIVHTLPTGLVEVERYQNGKKVIEQAKVKNLTELYHI